MANIFKAKTLVGRTGIFSHEVIAPNLVYNSGDQNIDGVKNFYDTPTVNGDGILSSGQKIIGGDLTGDLISSTINKIQGFNVSLNSPAPGQVLQWNSTASAWVPGDIPAGGNGGGGRVYYFNFGNHTGIAPTGGLPTNGDSAVSLLGRNYGVGSGQFQSNDLEPNFTERLISSFVSASGDAGITEIPAGLWDFNIWASVNSANATQSSIKTTVNIYNPDNSTYRQIAQSDNLYLYETTTPAQYILNVTVPQTGILPTERIYIEIYGKKYTSANRQITLYFDSYRPSHIHTTIPSVLGDGVVKVINGVFQSPATGIFDADVDNNANIAQSKIANLTTDLANLSTQDSTISNNLYITGSTLDNKIDSLSGVSVLTYGDQSINGIKDFNNQINVSGIQFDVLATDQIPPHQEGLLYYSDDTKTLNLDADVTDLSLQIGQENWVRAKNLTNSTITPGTVVYITGAQGNTPLVQRSIANGEEGSARTMGVAAHTITNNSKGYFTTFGLVENINTSAYPVGTTLYLSWESSGAFTGVKPQAPNHLVRVGNVIDQGNNGSIFVTIQNGFEVDELHDVKITNPQNKDGIIYNSASGLWLNTPAALANEVVYNTGDQIISGNKTFTSGNFLIVNAIDGAITPYYTKILSNNFGIYNPNEDPVFEILSPNGSNETIKFYNLGSRVIEISGSKFNIFNLPIYSNSDIYGKNLVYNTGNQIIYGDKSFYSNTKTLVSGNFEIISNNNLNGDPESLVDINSKNLFINSENIAFADDITTGLKKIVSYIPGPNISLYDFDPDSVLAAPSFDVYSSKFENGTEKVSSYGNNISLKSGSVRVFNDGEINLRYGKISWNPTFGLITIPGVGPASTTNLYPTDAFSLKSDMYAFYVNSGSGFFKELYANNLIYNTGNQTIYGNKTFANNIEVQGTGIFNSVDLSNISDFQFSGTNINLIDGNVYVSGGNIYISGNSVLTGIPDADWASQAEINSLSGYINSSSSNIVFTTGNQTINGLKTFTSGIDIYSGINPQSIRVFNSTGTNSGEFGLFGWQNNQLVIGSQATNSGILRDITLTGRNININASGVFNIFDPTNISGNLNVTGAVNINGDINSTSTGRFSAIDLNDIDTLSITGVGISISNSPISIIGTSRPTFNGTGILLSGEITNIVFTTGNQTIAGNKTFVDRLTAKTGFFGENNFMSGNWTAIAGGSGNLASGDYTFIGGGQSNCGVGNFSSIVGGQNNCTIARHTFIGGGFGNCTTAQDSFVGGGLSNCATDCASFVGGGQCNRASQVYASTVGGFANCASARFTSVAGGTNNRATEIGSFIGGGGNNCSAGLYAFVGGGLGNCAISEYSFAGGGTSNCAISAYSLAGGGQSNCAISAYSLAGGGQNNCATGCYSVTVGGFLNKSLSNFSFIGGGFSNCAPLTACHMVILGGFNNNGGSNGYFATIGGGTSNIAAGNYSAVLGGQNNQAQNEYSAVVVGSSNRAIGNHSFIGGGGFNCACSTFNIVVGGASNVASGIASVILGGQSNAVISSIYSATVGGQGNIINNSAYSFIGGGTNNAICCSNTSNIVGGASNFVSGVSSSILGGQNHIIRGDYSSTIGGFSHSILAERSFAIGGRQANIQFSHTGAGIISDGEARVHSSSGAFTLTLDFISGIYFAQPNIYGQLIFNSPINAINGIAVSGNPILTGVDLSNYATKSLAIAYGIAL